MAGFRCIVVQPRIPQASLGFAQLDSFCLFRDLDPPFVLYRSYKSLPCHAEKGSPSQFLSRWVMRQFHCSKHPGCLSSGKGVLVRSSSASVIRSVATCFEAGSESSTLSGSFSTSFLIADHKRLRVLRVLFCQVWSVFGKNGLDKRLVELLNLLELRRHKHRR